MENKYQDFSVGQDNMFFSVLAKDSLYSNNSTNNIKKVDLSDISDERLEHLSKSFFVDSVTKVAIKEELTRRNRQREYARRTKLFNLDETIKIINLLGLTQNIASLVLKNLIIDDKSYDIMLDGNILTICCSDNRKLKIKVQRFNLNEKSLTNVSIEYCDKIELTNSLINSGDSLTTEQFLEKAKLLYKVDNPMELDWNFNFSFMHDKMSYGNLTLTSDGNEIIAIDNQIIPTRNEIMSFDFIKEISSISKKLSVKEFSDEIERMQLKNKQYEKYKWYYEVILPKVQQLLVLWNSVNDTLKTSLFSSRELQFFMGCLKKEIASKMMLENPIKEETETLKQLIKK